MTPEIRIRVERLAQEWALHADGTLTDEAAAAITFRTTEPADVVLGEFVAVHDAEGCRVGHVSTASYHRRGFGPAYVVVGIELR